MSALYLYGFVHAGAASCVQRAGNSDKARIDDRHPVLLFEAGPVAAVVSAISDDAFPEADMQTPEWLADRACRHAALLSALRELTPVLPVKFGALFSSRQQLIALLDANASAIAEALDGLAGKAEWGVKAFVDRDWASAALSERDTRFNAKRSLSSSSPGLRYLQSRQLERQRASALSVSIRKRIAELERCLSLAGAECLRLPLAAAECNEAEMVLHQAVLLPVQGIGMLTDGLELLAQGWRADGWRIELSGPWPAYHFCPRLVESA